MNQSTITPTVVESQERLLFSYLQRLEKRKAGRRAVHIHLSNLRPENRRDHHVRLAADTFSRLVKIRKGQLFILKNLDLFFAYSGESHNDVETSIFKLLYLFSDDPMLKTQDEISKQNFCTFFNVERDFEEMLSLVRNMTQADNQNEIQNQEIKEGPPSSQVEDETGRPLSPRVLGNITRALQGADLTNMIRRQSICSLIGDAAPQSLFSELFISIDDVRNTLAPGVNLSVTKWLFNYLTETLDQCVLATLGKFTDLSSASEISINLNVSTLLSPEFMQFDDNIIASMRGSVIVELQIVDIFSDLNAFIFARDFAKDRGYRICVDGLNHETISLVNRERLGADLVKILWDKDLLEVARKKMMIGKIKSIGKSRVILCRCDHKEAVAHGHDIGISIFQGRYIEDLISKEVRHHNRKSAYQKSHKMELVT